MASPTPVLSDPSRRRLLAGSVLAVAGLGLACSRSGIAAATAPAGPALLVTIVPVDARGKPLAPVNVLKIVRSRDEWQQRLPPRTFAVARLGGTERPFSGQYNDLHARGVFQCACCDTALFDSRAKFDSGTGWPSFWQPLAKQNILDHADRSLGMVRTETLCRRCDAHLGHVFDDGPQPTGLRYCINSVALRFKPIT